MRLVDARSAELRPVRRVRQAGLFQRRRCVQLVRFSDLRLQWKAGRLGRHNNPHDAERWRHHPDRLRVRSHQRRPLLRRCRRIERLKGWSARAPHRDLDGGLSIASMPTSRSMGGLFGVGFFSSAHHWRTLTLSANHLTPVRAALWRCWRGGLPAPVPTLRCHRLAPSAGPDHDTLPAGRDSDLSACNSTRHPLVRLPVKNPRVRRPAGRWRSLR